MLLSVGNKRKIRGSECFLSTANADCPFCFLLQALRLGRHRIRAVRLKGIKIKSTIHTVFCLLGDEFEFIIARPNPIVNRFWTNLEFFSTTGSAQTNRLRICFQRASSDEGKNAQDVIWYIISLQKNISLSLQDFLFVRSESTIVWFPQRWMLHNFPKRFGKIFRLL